MADDVTFADERRPGRSGMTRGEVAAFFERRQQLYHVFDAAGLAAQYADEATIESPFGGVHVGRAAAERTLRAMFDALAIRTLAFDRTVIDGDDVAQIVLVEGVHAGEFMGLPATGKPFRFTVVFVYEMGDGRIVRERRIYDFTGLLVQLGVLRARPA